MGGAQSAPTRKISIPNEENAFIKVSDSVVERLKKCTDSNPQDYLKKNEEPVECPPNEFQAAVRNKENIAYHPGDPLMNFYYGPSVTSIRVLQEKEKELVDSENYWTKRISSMEKNHAKLNEILEKEYKKAVNEISCQTPRPPPNSPFPCCDEKEKILACYKKNPKEILLCAGEVTEFADCVHSKRLNFDKAAGCEK